MLSGFAQRLMPSLVRSTKSSTPIFRSYRGVSVMANSGAALPSPLVGGASMNIPRNALHSMDLLRSPISNSSVASFPSILPSSTPCWAGVAAHQQTRGFATKKHKRVIKLSKGFRGRANRCFRIAIRRLEKSWQYAYRDRKNKKREFRKLWIQRLNAGVRQYGVSYSRFIQMQGKSGVILDRKILSGLAMYEPFSFKAVVDVVKKVSAVNGAGK
jgi:large subunit ribosomal protein L20